jgi:hypothetical protein
VLTIAAPLVEPESEDETVAGGVEGEAAEGAPAADGETSDKDSDDK